MKPPARTTVACVVAAALMALAACTDGPGEAELMARARAAAAANDLPKANIELQSLLQKNPHSPDARFLLATILSAANRPALAVVELRKSLDQGYPEVQVVPALARALLADGQAKTVLTEFAAKALPDAVAQADLRTSMAQALLLTGKPAEADAALDEVLKTQPDFAPAVLMRARIQADRGDIPGALRDVAGLLARQPKVQEAWRVQGDLQFYGMGTPKEAIDSYTQALALSPGEPLTTKALIQVHMAQGDHQAAEKRVAELKRALPNDVQTRLYEAQIALLRNDPGKAQDLLQPVIKALPDNAAVLVTAAAIEMRFGRWTPAVAFLNRAVRLYPSLGSARLLLARANLRAGDPGRALEALGPMLQSRGRASPDVLALAAEAYLASGDPAQASRLFEAGLAGAPSSSQLQIGRARAMAAAGDGDKALHEFARLAATDSGSAADLGRISLLLRQGKAKEANEAIDALVKKRPNDPLGHKLRAEQALRVNNFDEAAAAFEAALKADPSYFPAVAGLAAIDQRQGKTDSARARLKALLDREPKMLSAQLALARLEQMVATEPGKVTPLLQAAVTSHPDEPSAHIALIDHLMAGGEPEAAVAAATQATRAIQDHADLQLKLGQAQLRAGQQQQALASFGKAVALRPSYMAGYLALGELQLQMGNAQGANASFRRALLIRGDDVRALSGATRSEIALGRYDAAAVLAKTATERVKRLPVGTMLDAEVQLARGRTAAAVELFTAALRHPAASGSMAAMAYEQLLRRGQPAAAQAIAAEWLRRRPNDAGFHYAMGSADLRADDAASAERRFQEVLRLKPDHAQALNNLAWIMARQGKPGAVEVARKAQQLAPRSAHVMDTLALALKQAGQLDAAAQAQLDAIRLTGRSEAGMYNLSLARIYQAQGKRAEALLELQKLAALGPGFAAADEVARLQQQLGR